MIKRIIAPIVISGTLLGGVAVAGTAYASTPAAATATTKTPTAIHPGRHALRRWLRAHRRQIRRAGVAVSAKAIGVTPQDLVTQLRSGKSIADVAGEHGVSAQTVVKALVTAADAKINQEVSDHKLTSAEASTIKTALPVRAAQAVDHTF